MNETTTPETEVGTTELSEDGAVQELLKRWQQPEQSEEEPKEEPEAEQTAEVDAEAEGEPEAESEEDGDIEIDVGGEKFKAPKALTETFRRVEAKVKEIEAGATRRFQEAADLRKSVEAEKAALVEIRKIAHEQADLIAEHRMVAKRLQQIEGVDINAVDQDTLTRLNAEYNQLQAAQRRITEQYQQSVAQSREKEGEALKARLEHGQKVLASKLKNWGPERAKALAEYAANRGVPEEVLRGITEPWFVEILDDAQYGRTMREHKSTTVKKVAEVPKTLKPGASGQRNPNAKAADDAMARLKKTGTAQDAAMALLARSAMRRK